MKPIDSVFIIAAKRTAFGTFGGSLKNFSANDLGVIAAKAAIEQSRIPVTDFDHVVFGNVLQTSADAIYHARHVGLKSGLPQHVPALTVNRLCGSGFQAIANAAELILTGQANVVLAGGAESMSQSPHIIRGARWGIPLGKGELEDSLWSALTDSYTGFPMAITAENLAVKFNITQDEVDDFSILSQQRFAYAQQNGYFAQEITPVLIPSKKETITFAKDEHNRPDTTKASFAKLPKVFKKDGVIHAGAASGICDGAAALVIASKNYVEKNKIKPLAQIVSFASVGCDPTIMGIGPVAAVKKALEIAGLSLNQIDLIEVNEAFAPQFLAVQKSLELNMVNTNVNGGAIAIGHPLAASGARITSHLCYELQRQKKTYGIGSACIGGGQGIAMILRSFVS